MTIRLIANEESSKGYVPWVPDTYRIIPGTRAEDDA